jgi:chromosome segregation ATPase
MVVQDIEEVLKRLKSMQDEMTKRMDGNTKAMQENLKKMGDNQAKAEMIARMDARQAEIDAWQARMDARQARLVAFQARRDAWLTDMSNSRKETVACLEETEARLEVEDKPASVDTTPEVAHEQEVPLEANVEKIEPNPGETEAIVER